MFRSDVKGRGYGNERVEISREFDYCLEFDGIRVVTTPALYGAEKYYASLRPHCVLSRSDFFVAARSFNQLNGTKNPGAGNKRKIRRAVSYRRGGALFARSLESLRFVLSVQEIILRSSYYDPSYTFHRNIQ